MADSHTGRVVSAEFERSAGVFAIGKEERAAQGLPPVHLLVVDDDEHVRGVCRSIAEEAGMKVFDVGTGEEALEVLGASRRAGQSRTRNGLAEEVEDSLPELFGRKSERGGEKRPGNHPPRLRPLRRRVNWF